MKLVFIALILGLHCWFLVESAVHDAPVVDETGHMVAGLSIWELGRHDLYCVNPPLVC